MFPKPRYYTLFWRWHFYAGLIVTPIMLIMAVTGGIYLLQPQIEGWLYKDLLTLPAPYSRTIDHDAIINAAREDFSVKQLHSYVPPSSPEESAQLILTTTANAKLTAFFHPGSYALLGTVQEKWQLMHIARELHKGLMLGTPGRIIAELAACWIIVLIITGLYLWWPRGNKNRGIIVPNTQAQGRKLWREFHTVPGAIASLWILALLITGLPWSFVWGGLLDNAAQKAGEGFPTAIFSNRPHSISTPGLPDISLNKLIEQAHEKGVHHGFKIDYPWGENGSYALMPLRHGCDNKDMAYVFFDRRDGALLAEYHWQDMGKIGRATSLGVQFHEGRLFGSANQMLNLAAVLILISLGITGPILWWKRKPQRALGAPRVENSTLSKPLIGLIAVAALLLPLFGLSVLLIWLGEMLVVQLRGKGNG